LRAFFEEIYDKSKTEMQFRVSVVDITGTKINGFRAHAPRGRHPRAKIDMLNQPTSGFSRAISSSKNMVIIEDIEAEGSKKFKDRCWVTEEGGSDSGSALIYVVHDTLIDAKPYAICIRASKPHVFKKSDRQFFETVMNRFGDRLCIEYSLHVVKDYLADIDAAPVQV
jgi:hypothetical protein